MNLIDVLSKRSQKKALNIWFSFYETLGKINLQSQKDDQWFLRDGGGVLTGKGHQYPSWRMEMFYVLIGGPLGDTVVNTHQSTHLKWVHFTVCRLSLNKADFQGKKIGKKKRARNKSRIPFKRFNSRKI